jgi:hypothetical protein
MKFYKNEIKNSFKCILDFKNYKSKLTQMTILIELSLQRKSFFLMKQICESEKYKKLQN